MPVSTNLHEHKRESVMTAPREANFFQDVLYSDTAGPESAFEAEDWMSGLNAYPTHISLREVYMPNKQQNMKATGCM